MSSCYACGKAATTTEHVPPQCLFPKAKDKIANADLRRNLMTVPSCPEHNLSKSCDDEYFLWVMSLNLPANSIAHRQLETKLSRAFRYRPKLAQSIFKNTKDVIIAESHSGRQHKALEVPLDGKRLERVLDLTARGVFCHHFGIPWLGTILMRADFVDYPDSPNQDSLQANRIALYESAEQYFAGDARHGENPEVFWYKINESSDQHRCLMRLAFFTNCTVTAFFNNPLLA